MSERERKLRRGHMNVNVLEKHIVQADNIPFMKKLYPDTIRSIDVDHDWTIISEIQAMLKGEIGIGKFVIRPYASRTTQTNVDEFIKSLQIGDPRLENLMATIYSTAVEAHRVLVDGGTYKFMCDNSFKYYAKIVLDRVFGKNNFFGEIVLNYTRGWRSTKMFGFPRLDNVLIYYKGRRDRVVYNPIMVDVHSEWRESIKKRHGGFAIEDRSAPKSESRVFMYLARSPDQLTILVYDRDAYEKCLEDGGGLLVLDKEKGFDTVFGGRYLDWKLDPSKSVVKDYTDSKVPLGSVWEVPRTQNAEEPTSKHRKIYEMLIRTFSNEGDLIMDITGGWGNFAVVAERLKRRWIIVDKSQRQCIRIGQKLSKYGIQTHRLSLDLNLDEMIQVPDVKINIDLVEELNSLSEEVDYISRLSELVGGENTHGPEEYGQDINIDGTFMVQVKLHPVTVLELNSTLSSIDLCRKKYPHIRTFVWVSPVKSKGDRISTRIDVLKEMHDLDEILELDTKEFLEIFSGTSVSEQRDINKFFNQEGP